MREILFRGKCINNGEWIESMTIAKGVIKRKRDCFYMENSLEQWIGVIPESISQFTGLLDKNGVKIFEGDKVSTDLKRPYFTIIFKNGCFMAECFDDNLYHDILFPVDELNQAIYKYGEVIGNIHE